ncbi:MAG: hypothetical protein C0483_17855 [Pirellula sp.]|nr:hypothetical protein [Pirellula sp.]
MAMILCPGCSSEISDNVYRCPLCAQYIGGDIAPRNRTDEAESAGMRILFPVGRSGWAIASGYLGLISILLIPAPMALFTGIMAIRDIRRNPKKHGMGRAVFGIVMGAFGTLSLLFVGIIMLGDAARGR